MRESRISFGGGRSGLFSFRGGGERRISTIGSILLLVTIGLLGLRSSSTDHALAEPEPRPLSDAPWSANVKVNDDPGTALQYGSQIAVDSSGNAYAVWEDYRGSSDIYFSYRPVGGSWGANVKVNDDSSRAFQEMAAIAVDSSGNAYALWGDARYNLDFRNPPPPEPIHDIYFSYRPAGGSWGASVKVNDDPGTADQLSLAIAVDPSGNAYAVWQDERNGNWDIYFSYRPVGGSWGTNVQVNDDPGTAPQVWPAIAVDSWGNAYAVWSDMRNGDRDIYFSCRPAGGSWGVNVKVNDDPGTADQLIPAIAVDPSGNAYAVWIDGWSNPDIYFSHRPAGGSWGVNVKVNDDTGTATQWLPDIAVDPSGNAYLVWYDYRNGDSDIYFSYRPVGGSWGANVRVNDDPGTASQYQPQIAVDPWGNAYAVWTDCRNGGYDIYFSYRPAGGVYRIHLFPILKNYSPR